MIAYLFYILFLVTPLIFTQKTSELFEFNKIVLIYLISILVLIFWILNILKQKRIIYRHTILEKPLLIFLGTQIISTLISLDRHTSFFGYYSRFNGGLASTISYIILYFAFVTFMNKTMAKKAIFFLLASGIAVSIWAILEHFGHSFSCLIIRQSFDDGCWVQDVQNRVFASLGQPNWLAAFMVALIPTAWFFGSSELRRKVLGQKYIGIFISVLFYISLLFTKSRSGILGFVVAFIIYWGLSYFKNRKNKKKFIEPFLITTSILLTLTFIIGTPWTSKEMASNETALETGGTESGDIRKIVWKGAVDAWTHYPIFGTGVETFSIAYNKFRPQEHNLTSEWDFNYNKAHNEYLNYLTTTGVLGLLAYMVLISISLYQIFKSQYRIPLSAGYVSILITNFFGFSTTATSLLFFLFPAMATALSEEEVKIKNKTKNLSLPQYLALVIVMFMGGFLLLATLKYWYADTLYLAGRSANSGQEYKSAHENLLLALSISPSEPVYWIALAESSVNLALSQDSIELARQSEDEANKASDLSPNNLNIKKMKYSFYTSLAQIDPSYLFKARDELLVAIDLAPTDAKLYYLLGQSSYRIKQSKEAIRALEYAISLKPDYDRAKDLLKILVKN